MKCTICVGVNVHHWITYCSKGYYSHVINASYYCYVNNNSKVSPSLHKG